MKEYRVIIEYQAGKSYKSFTDRYIAINKNIAVRNAKNDLKQIEPGPIIKNIEVYCYQ